VIVGTLADAVDQIQGGLAAVEDANTRLGVADVTLNPVKVVRAGARARHIPGQAPDVPAGRLEGGTDSAPHKAGGAGEKETACCHREPRTFGYGWK
jgi:hypothetical protein